MPTGSTLNQLKTLVKSVYNSSETRHNDRVTKSTVLNDDHERNKSNDLSPELQAKVKRSISRKRWKNKNQSKVNASERERKGRLAANIAKLKEIIPVNASKMQTRECVLEEAVQYIVNLNKKVEDILMKEASETITAELKALRKKVADLENERLLYRAVLQSHGIPPVLNTIQGWKSKVALPRLESNKASNKKDNRVIRKNRNTIASCTTGTTLTPVDVGTPVSNTTTSINPTVSCDQIVRICEVEQSVESIVPPRTTTQLHKSHTAKITQAPIVSVCSDSVMAPTTLCGEAIENSIGMSLPSTKDVSATSSDNETTTIKFPPINTLQYQTRGAFCTPTWSLARIQDNSSDKIPMLASIPIETIRSTVKVTTQINSITDSSVSVSVGDSNRNLNGSVDSGSVGGNTTVYVSDALTSVGITDSRIIQAETVEEVHSNNSLMLPMNVPSSSSVGLIPHDTQSHLISSASQFPASCQEKAQYVSDARESEQNVSVNIPSKKIPPPESPALDRNLLSWLRSYDTPITATSVPATLLVTIMSAETPTLRTNQLSYSVQTLTTPSSKKAANSFNIASLMKSKDVMPNTFSPAVSNSSPSIQTTLDSHVKEMALSEADPTDFSTATQKDIFHQSFENDFLDCLQNIPNLFLNNSQARTAEKRKEANMSLDFNDLLQNENSSSALLREKESSIERVIVSSQTRPPEHQFVQNPGSMDTVNPTAAKDKHDGLCRLTYPNQGPVSCSYVNASTSLWQPAISNVGQTKPALSHLPQIPDCFSPITYQYLNTNTPRLSHNVCAPSQALPHYSSNQTWMPHSSQSNRYPASTTHRLTTLSNTNGGASISEPTRQKVEVPKKRKAARSTQSNKRKKSATKPMPSTARKDTHGIPQLVHYQYTTHVPQQPAQVLPNTQGVPNAGGIHCTNNANIITGNRRGLFVPTTNTVMGPPHMTYNPDYGGQSNLFHSPPPVGPQAPSYPAAHGGYFPYNHPVAQQPPRHVYVPRFANTNNSNNIIPSLARKPQKGSQHHIRQILG